MLAEVTTESSDPIAIVAMACVFPGCQTPEELWDLVLNRGDATTDPPPGRWLIDPARALDPQVGLADHVYSIRGGFVDAASLDPVRSARDLGLDPGMLDRLDPLFHLVIHVAKAAWRDAQTESVDKSRVGVIFGNIVLPTDAASAFSREILGRVFEERLGIAVAHTQSTEPINAFPAGLPAALAARALGLGGVAYTLDAACASSLYALKLAALELQSRRADAMLCGGVSRPDPLYTQMGFSQLRALSARGKPAPFDRQADGLVVGEGAGMFVLKRLSDALAEGDAIHGIIAGMGLSNDVDGDLLAPSAEGQLRAMRRAYDQAGWRPGDLDLIECHATGTPLGDAVEIESLTRLWRDDAIHKPDACAIGSVKSNIGHALTAAGAAGLVKVLMALRHHLLPPTANFEQPNPGLRLEGSPFRVLKCPEPWPRRAPGQPRRAAISGFGLGGINAHVLIEEWLPPDPPAPVGAAAVQNRRPAQPNSRRTEPPPIAIVGLAAHFGPFADRTAFLHRLVSGDPSVEPFDPTNWWGVPDTEWYRKQGWGGRSFAGYYLDSLRFEVDQFRIPPRELAEMLPQQSLMLAVTAAALRDAGWQSQIAGRAAVLVGIGLDLNTTNYQLRWWLAQQASQWSKALDLNLRPEELAHWTDELHAAVWPALTANRTMGGLGSLVASRIAREFRIGGPSFSISCDENSGIQALAIAADWLARREVDTVVVGAVDFAGDVRAVLAGAMLPADPLGALLLDRGLLGNGQARSLPAAADSELGRSGRRPRLAGAGANDCEIAAPAACDGAVCLVLKRLDDALYAHDRVHAIIRKASAQNPCLDTDKKLVPPSRNESRLSDQHQDRFPQPTIGYLDVQCPDRSDLATPELSALATSELTSPDGGTGTCALGSILADLGRNGAAAGLAAVAKAAICLGEQVIPATDGAIRWLDSVAQLSPALYLPRGRQFWLRNRAQGPRRAAVCCASLGGTIGEVLLEELETSRDFPSASVGQTFEADVRLESLTYVRPRRSHALFALAADDQRALIAQIEELAQMVQGSSCADIDSLARQWWRRRPLDARLPRSVAIVADTVDTLRRHLESAAAGGIENRGDVRPGAGSIYATNPEPAIAASARVAFVFPGLGNSFAGMGREFSTMWPEVLRQQDSESAHLRDQFDPKAWWSSEPLASFTDDRAPILGTIWVGSLVTTILRSLGVNPDAAIGYSMGESSALVALGAWRSRDLLCSRLRSSPLFQTELAGPRNAARRAWKLAPSEPVDWVAGVISRPAETVEAAVSGSSRVYLMIRNTADESVIGGERDAVDRIVKALRASFVALPTVSTVHCEIGGLVEAEYRALHDLETHTPVAIDFYSGVWGHPYAVDRQSAADAIAAQARHPIDFPAVIERAYRDGIRVFLEVGPGSSCTRLVDRILGGRPHLARAACRSDGNSLGTVLELLAELIAHRLPVDLSSLYGPEPNLGGDEPVTTARSPARSGGRGAVHVEVRGRAFSVPQHPHTAGESPGFLPVYEVKRATAEAHRAFLRTSEQAADLLGKLISAQLGLLETYRTSATRLASFSERSPTSVKERARSEPADRSQEGKVASKFVLDRDRCLEFAVGSIAAVLGRDYAPVDHYPTRVRLPDEPLMLVDRVLEIEGRPRSLQAGRVVTEHVIGHDSWYLDGGRAPACIAIEAGQADLFLSAYLGVDFETRGEAVYRLLDATVTFHRGLPSPGEVIRYDIRIARFFRQGKTILFHFQFEATASGEPLITMSDGCAGFFSAAELFAGKGIVARKSKRDLRSATETAADADSDLVPMSAGALAEHQIDALRQGDLAAAFGAPFEHLAATNVQPLPGGRLALVHRVLALEPRGGPHGLGLIRAQADVHPGDWFLACHFVDDRVMPGTLMYECCLHALRILLMRIGWTGPRNQAVFEPVPGLATRLRCRGQVVESTRVVTYEVVISKRGYRPQPYAVADALIFADGKPIVEVIGITLQLSGTDRQRLEQLWANTPLPTYQPHGSAAVLFDHDRILSFATGKPSEAFGDRYRPFDEGRFIARLPAPPFQFLHRITQIDAQPWVLAAGSAATAEYDVAADDWYFAADRQDRMPHAVLLEVALQACGWLAAYMGSALNSDDDLKFRNLGGTATQHQAVTRITGTLSTRVRLAKVTKSAGMILQDFEFSIHSRHGLVYRGSTSAVFLHPSVLDRPAENIEWRPYQATAEERARAQSLAYPAEPPFPDSRWRMVDQIDELLPDGGPHGLGMVRGSGSIDPEAWFFKAHFQGDPVCPGSLGLEAVLQLLKTSAAARWGVRSASAFESPSLAVELGWNYRGQITPANRRVIIQADIKQRDDQRRWLLADGYLEVDDHWIYRMSDVSLRLCDS
jgi:PfaB family protein